MQATTQEELIEHELPPRPRHRLLGAGGNPVAVALLCVLVCACGFIGGVLVEKGQTDATSDSGSSGTLASQLAALRGGSASTARGNAGGGVAALLAGAGGRSGAGGGSSGGTGAPTVGQVAYVRGHTLYLTNLEGTTIKVTASAGADVSRTVKASVSAIHPGETVIVAGSAGSNGEIHAQSIRASEAGGLGGFGGGGLGGASLFGGGGGRSREGAGRSPVGGPGGGGSSGSGGEGPVLFGK